MSLATELKETVATVKSAVPPSIFAAIGKSIEGLHASGIASRAAGVGSTIGLPTLPDIEGYAMNLADKAGHGLLVITFYRGGWCPYCNVTLRAFSRKLAEIEAAGASFVAITPELADNAAETAGKNDLGFPILIDKGNAYARTLGLVFSLPESLQPQYREIGIDLKAWNGDASHELPLAATYVVDGSGTVRWAFVEADFTQRAEPSEVIAALARVS